MMYFISFLLLQHSRTPSSQKIFNDSQQRLFGGMASGAETELRKRQNKTPVLSDAISPSFSRQNSSMTLLSGKTSITDWYNTETSSIRPISSPRQHHVFKVKDGASDRLHLWDLGGPTMKMAGEQVQKSEDRNLPEIPSSKPNSASSGK